MELGSSLVGQRHGAKAHDYDAHMFLISLSAISGDDQRVGIDSNMATHMYSL